MASITKRRGRHHQAAGGAGGAASADNSCIVDRGVVSSLVAEAAGGAFSSLESHSFLTIHTVYGYLKQINELWSQLHSMSIRNSTSSVSSREDGVILAERALAMNYSPRERLWDDWFVQWKIGAGAVLLLWGFSECFNNERQGHHIWDVRKITNRLYYQSNVSMF